MKTAALLIDGYGRMQQLVHRSCDGIGNAGLAFQPAPESNSIAWLVWHLTRIQDDHISAIAGVDQVWITTDWHAQLGMEADEFALGQGDSAEAVAAIQPTDAIALVGYHDEVIGSSIAYLGGIDADELDRIVDVRYTPPVSAGVRLISVLSDNLQHAGQALYVRGIFDRLVSTQED
jgi:hypothetical protein